MSSILVSAALLAPFMLFSTRAAFASGSIAGSKPNMIFIMADECVPTVVHNDGTTGLITWQLFVDIIPRDIVQPRLR